MKQVFLLIIMTGFLVSGRLSFLLPPKLYGGPVKTLNKKNPPKLADKVSEALDRKAVPGRVNEKEYRQGPGYMNDGTALFTYYIKQTLPLKDNVENIAAAEVNNDANDNANDVNLVHRNKDHNLINIESETPDADTSSQVIIDNPVQKEFRGPGGEE